MGMGGNRASFDGAGAQAGIARMMMNVIMYHVPASEAGVGCDGAVTITEGEVRRARRTHYCTHRAPVDRAGVPEPRSFFFFVALADRAITIR